MRRSPKVSWVRFGVAAVTFLLDGMMAFIPESGKKLNRDEFRCHLTKPGTQAKENGFEMRVA